MQRFCQMHDEDFFQILWPSQKTQTLLRRALDKSTASVASTVLPDNYLMVIIENCQSMQHKTYLANMFLTILYMILCNVIG